jgi:hypothetical protein
VVRCKYYIIYVAYTFVGKLVPGSDGSWKPLHRVPNSVNGLNICDLIVLMGRA